MAILTYHRIHDIVPGLALPTWNVTPSVFRAQMTGLLARGYRPCSLRSAIECHQAGRAAPERSFIVTFDDAYDNVYHYAWPVLRELQIPATVFLATAFLDLTRPFPFDDWTASGTPQVPLVAWQPITTPHCREMQDTGLIELGCHTHTHGDFRGRPAELVTDIQTSLAVLRERFGVSQATFALPYGDKDKGFSSPELAQAAHEAGVLCSLTTESRLVDVSSDPFDWGRFTGEPNDNATTLSAKLDGWYELARSTWRRLRGMRSPARPSPALDVPLVPQITS